MLSIKEINLLQAQNEGLKKQNAELQKENAELKAENERLKEEIKEVKKYQYQQEYLDKEIEEMQKALKTLAEGLNIRQQTLQDIKAIVEEDCKQCFEIDGFSKPDDCGICPYNKILQKITKAESEVK